MYKRQGFYRYDDGRSIGVAPDFAGEGSGNPPAIRARILDAIGAEARRAVDEGVATEGDVDLALRLGAGHPIGPFERADRQRAG